MTEERGFTSQGQVLPTGLRFHGRDIVTWLHLTVREAVKCHLKCAQRRDILGAFESEGYIKVLFGSVAEICQGQEKAIGGDLGHFASSNGVAQDLGGMGWTHYYQNSV